MQAMVLIETTVMRRARPIWTPCNFPVFSSLKIIERLTDSALAASFAVTSIFSSGICISFGERA